MFSIKANSFRVVKEPQERFYGLTIPLTTPFIVSEDGRKCEYGPLSGHLLKSGHAFDLAGKRNARFLVCNFLAEPISEYAKKLNQSNSTDFSLLDSEVNISQSGSNLLRSVARVWSEISNTNPASTIAIGELEDDLLASFVLYANEDRGSTELIRRRSLHHINQVEEYICDNLNESITRDQLSEVAGCSIRSLSRSFEVKHGIGPMAFTKERRLDAAYLDLLSAEPDATTVTKVAINYGFSHIGKFAIDYGKTFGESPSTSLARP